MGEKTSAAMVLPPVPFPINIDRAFLDFEQIQTEIHYQQAQDALRQVLRNVDLTAPERAGLETELDQLAALLDRLEQTVIQIAVFGMVGRGKSSVLNALAGAEIFQTGPLHGVTQDVAQQQWQWCDPQGEAVAGTQRLAWMGGDRSQIQLVDTPGIDEVDGETREKLAQEVARQADLILFVIAGDLTKVEYQALCRLREVGKPMLLVFNKIDQYPEADRLAIYEKLHSDRLRQLITPEEIVMVASAPLVVRVQEGDDGRMRYQKERGEPQIAPLREKILSILEKEGKDLLALNALLRADEIQDRLVQRKLDLRHQAAQRVIEKAMGTKAIAVALNPITAVDLFTGAAVDVALILRLSHLYGLPMGQQEAIALLQRLALSMGGIGLSELLATFGLGSLKSLLGGAAPLSGGLSLAPYLSVAITQGAVAGVTTYTLGQVTRTYLAQGATWGEGGPKAVMQKILATLDEQSLVGRLREELQQHLRRRAIDTKR